MNTALIPLESTSMSEWEWKMGEWRNGNAIPFLSFRKRRLVPTALAVVRRKEDVGEALIGEKIQ